MDYTFFKRDGIDYVRIVVSPTETVERPAVPEDDFYRKAAKAAAPVDEQQRIEKEFDGALQQEIEDDRPKKGKGR
jgi:hypothetical protein